MPINTDERPKIDFSRWIKEKSVNIIKSVVTLKKILTDYEDKMSDLDREWMTSELYHAIYNAGVIASFANEDINSWTKDWAMRILEGGEDELDNFMRTLGYKVSEKPKHLTIETVEEIIKLADLLYPPGQYQSPKAISSTELIDEYLQDQKFPNPNRANLINRLDQLSQNELAELMALMWIGRGEEAPERWKYVVKHAMENLDDAARYMAGKFPLASYLRHGLEKVTNTPNSPF